MSNDENEASIEKTLNSSCQVEIIDKRIILDCECENKSFIVLVTPIIANGGAQIVNMACVKCQRLYPISDRGTIGEKVQLITDGLGRNHHRLQAETGYHGLAQPPSPSKAEGN